MARPRRHPDSPTVSYTVYVSPACREGLLRRAREAGVSTGVLIEQAFPPLPPLTLPHRWKAMPTGVVACERCRVSKNNPTRSDDCLDEA